MSGKGPCVAPRGRSRAVSAGLAYFSRGEAKLRAPAEGAALATRELWRPPRLRDNRAGAEHRLLSRTDHSFRRPVVVLADVFEQFGAGAPAKQEASGPGCRIGPWIIDGYLILECVEVGPGEPFDKVELFCV